MKRQSKLISRPISLMIPDEMTTLRPQPIPERRSFAAFAKTPRIRRITAYRNIHDGTRYPIGQLANGLLWQWSVYGKSTCTHLRK